MLAGCRKLSLCADSGVCEGQLSRGPAREAAAQAHGRKEKGRNKTWMCCVAVCRAGAAQLMAEMLPGVDCSRTVDLAGY